MRLVRVDVRNSYSRDYRPLQYITTYCACPIYDRDIQIRLTREMGQVGERIYTQIPNQKRSVETLFPEKDKSPKIEKEKEREREREFSGRFSERDR